MRVPMRIGLHLRWSMKCCCGAINWRILTCEQGAASRQVGRYLLLSRYYIRWGGGAFCVNAILRTIACVLWLRVSWPVVVTGIIRCCAALVSHRL